MNNEMVKMTWKEYESRKDDYIILPVGSTEQHGKHLPLSVDTVIAEGFSKALAEKLNAVVAPTLNYGYKSQPFSGGGPLFPGTIDLSGLTLQYLVTDILEEFIRDGFKKIIVFSAHFENEAFIMEAMDILSRKYEDVQMILTNWWDCISDELVEEIFNEVPFPGWALEHAAVTETSLMMYLAPELVREDEIKDMENVIPEICKRYPATKDMVNEDGVLASAKSSSKEKGKLIFDNGINAISAYIESL